MTSVFINRIATAVPDFDIHSKFIEYCPRLLPDKRSVKVFQRMAERAQIEHRYSFLEPHLDEDKLDLGGFYKNEAFPDTQARMQFYERFAFTLAKRALGQLDLSSTTHLVTTTCTGFYAPGLDHQLIHHYGLPGSVERTNVGFMGCYAAINALKLARHIVRSEPDAKVLVLNLELCTLHLKPTGTLEEILSFAIFSDGCAASIVTAEPAGLEIQGFNTDVLPETEALITWRIGNQGFDMQLSGKVPGVIASHLPLMMTKLLDGYQRSDIAHWAIHPGGRTVLDAVKAGAELEENQLLASREVLRKFGNMSSATIMFVLQAMMNNPKKPGPGLAMAFGPGLTVESMLFDLKG
ncbi:type III polyketide synthase [Vreelandella indica]|uniref:type III polyketide synthase n=1 Tax=Vreelandella indica TaxID=3126500 RepID=UPI00300E69D3|tara:strand:+ start:614 stop:1666 length:1053 start_codon:yes stop_codon:yes gene_type:complete